MIGSLDCKLTGAGTDGNVIGSLDCKLHWGRD